MKVIHIYTAYPNKYHPYNIEFINKLSKKGFINRIVSFSFNGEIDNKTKYLFNNPNKFIRIYNLIFDFIRFIKYKKISKQSLSEALISFARYKPLLKYKDYCIHIHHIQVINKSFYSFLKCFDLEYGLSIRGSDITIHYLYNDEYRENINLALINAKLIHTVSSDLASKVHNITRSNNIITIPRYTSLNNSNSKKNIVKDNLFILSVGRYHWVKGYNYILESLYRISQKNIKFKYFICGDGTDEETKHLKYLIEMYNLNDKVELVGFVEQNKILKYYEISNIYICGSLYEGMPNAVINAINLHVPIVATSVGGVPEIIKNKVNGLLCKPADSIDMEDKLLKIINREWELSDQNKLNNYNSETVMDKYIDFYKQLYTTIN